MPTVKDFLIQLDATTEGLRRELKRGEQAVQQTVRTVERETNRAERAFGGLNRALGLFGVALSAGTFVKLGADALRMADRLSDASKALGLSTTQLQSLQFAARTAGTDLGSLDSALDGLARRLGDAAAGSEEALRPFAALGVKVRDAEGNARKLDAVLPEVAAKILNLGNETDRVAAATDLFGKQGVRLVPLLGELAGGWGEVEGAARKAGQVMSEETVQALGDAADEIELFQNKITIAVGGILGDLRRLFDGVHTVSELQASIETLGKASGTTAFGFLKGLQTNAESSLPYLLGEQRDIARLRGFGTLNKPKGTGTYTPGGGGGGGGGASEIEKAQKAYDKLTASVKETTRDLEQQATLFGKSVREIAYAAKYQELMNAALAMGGELSTDILVEIDQLATAFADATGALDEMNRSQAEAKRLAEDNAEAAQKAAQDFQREVEQVASSIADDLTEAIFEGGELGFENITKNIGLWLKRIALEVLKQQIVLPITTQLVGSFPGLFGIQGSGGAAASGSFGGLFDSIGKALSSPIGSLFGGGGSSQVLTGAGGLLTGGGVQSSLGATGLGALSFGDFLGGAGAGAGIGSLLFGLGIGKTSIGTSIGGALGGALGTLATPFLGPLGPIAGGLLGGLFGGLFGNNKPSNRGQGALVDLSSGDVSTYGLKGKKFSQENRDIAVKLAEDLVAFNQMVQVLTGLTSTATLGFHVGDRDPLRLTGAGGKNDVLATFGSKSEDNVGRLQDASFVALLDSLGALDPAMKAAIERSVELRDTMEEMAQDFSVIRLVLGDSEEELTGAAKALHDLNEEFDQATKRAKELGLSEAAVAAKRAEAIAELRSGFLAGIKDQILAIQDPVAAALKALDDAFVQIRKDAQTLGVGLVEVEQLYGLRRQEIIEQFARGATDTLQRFLEEITFGETSGASPENRLAGSRAAFEAAAAQALAGDAGARDRLAELGGVFLESSRAFNASGGAYYADRQRVEDVVRAALAGVPGHAGGTFDFAGGLTWVGERGRELIAAPPGAAILPHAISEMVASGAANGGGGREGVRMIAELVGEIRAKAREDAETQQLLGSLVGQLRRLLHKLDKQAA